MSTKNARKTAVSEVFGIDVPKVRTRLTEADRARIVEVVQDVWRRKVAEMGYDDPTATVPQGNGLSRQTSQQLAASTPGDTPVSYTTEELGMMTSEDLAAVVIGNVPNWNAAAASLGGYTATGYRAMPLADFARAWGTNGYADHD